MYIPSPHVWPQSYEPLFYKYGVDIVFNGHVHA